MSIAGDLNAALRRIERHLADARPGTHDHERWSRQHRLALEALHELDPDTLEDVDPGAGQPPWSRVDIEHTPTGGTILETIPHAGQTRDRERLAMKLRTHGPTSTTTDAAGRDPLEHPDT